jgi:pimeloyl-ACP methyl ester carboxylesterase
LAKSFEQGDCLVNCDLSEKQIDLEEYRTTYLEGGEASNSDPILFLHGWTTSTAPYRESLTFLCQRYRVIAPDLPGFGKCIHPKCAPDHASYVNCIVSFLEALNIQKAHMIGHSGGGAVAIALAATRPSFVSSIIISDSTGIPLGTLPKVALGRAIDMVMQTPKVKFIPMLRFYRALLHNWVFNTQNMIQCTQLALKEDIRPLLPEIKSPALVLWGGSDRFIPLQFGYEFSQGIPGTRMLVAQGEHHEWAMFRPEKFVPIIFDFLSEVEKIQTPEVV